MGGTTDTKEDLAFVTLQSKQCTNSWKSHFLRSTNQDKSILDVIDELDETSALLVLDYAMKYLPKKFLTCNQDSSAVFAKLNDFFRRLKDVMPHLQSIYLRQDNVGCYHCALTLVTASKVAELNNLFLRRMDFSDPQRGKRSSDRKAATIKSYITIHLNSGHDIESGISNAGGNKIIWRCPWSKSSVMPPLSSIKKPVKWDGVSFVNNVQYGEEGVRVWRSGYKIGRGKFIPWSKFHVPDQDEVPTLECSAASENIKANFVPIKPRRAEVAKTSQKHQDSTDEGTDDSSEESRDSTTKIFFFCSEEGCIKSYQRHSSLQKHLECGRHICSWIWNSWPRRARVCHLRPEKGPSAVP